MVLCIIVFLCASPSSELVVFEELPVYSDLSVSLPLRRDLGTGPEPGDPFSSGGPKPEEEGHQSNASGGRLGPRNQEYGDAASTSAKEERKDGPAS